MVFVVLIIVFFWWLWNFCFVVLIIFLVLVRVLLFFFWIICFLLVIVSIFFDCKGCFFVVLWVFVIVWVICVVFRFFFVWMSLVVDVSDVLMNFFMLLKIFLGRFFGSEFYILLVILFIWWSVIGVLKGDEVGWWGIGGEGDWLYLLM